MKTDAKNPNIVRRDYALDEQQLVHLSVNKAQVKFMRRLQLAVRNNKTVPPPKGLMYQLVLDPKIMKQGSKSEEKCNAMLSKH